LPESAADSAWRTLGELEHAVALLAEDASSELATDAAQAAALDELEDGDVAQMWLLPE
jgi:hypothetical protein